MPYTLLFQRCGVYGIMLAQDGVICNGIIVP